MEDRIGWDDDYLFVIDGASGLNSLNVTSYGSDAAWFADRSLQCLKQFLPHMELSLAEVLHRTADTLKTEYESCFKQHENDGNPDFPSAGIALLRLNGDNLEYIGLGDCTVVIEAKEGACEVLQETQLTTFDRAVIEKMTTLCRETGCSMREARKAFNDLLIKNRNLRNHPEGYWIFDPSGMGIPHARQKSWPASQIKSVSLMSDGFFQLSEPFAITVDAIDTHRQIQIQGLSVMAKKLFSAQQADANCLKYPRFKRMDDTSAVLASLD